MNALSERLRRLRIASGMSQAKLAEQMVLSRSAITQIEAGNRDVTADELARFAAVFRQSPSSLLTNWEEASQRPVSTLDTLLDELLAAYPALGDSASFRGELEGHLELASLLTEMETVLGLDVYGPETFVFRGASPQTRWEAAHQGYAAAEGERRRLDLGSSPNRDMAETLATLRIRATRLPLPSVASCVSINTPGKARLSSLTSVRASKSGGSGWHMALLTCCSTRSKPGHAAVRTSADITVKSVPTRLPAAF